MTRKDNFGTIKLKLPDFVWTARGCRRCATIVWTAFRLTTGSPRLPTASHVLHKRLIASIAAQHPKRDLIVVVADSVDHAGSQQHLEHRQRAYTWWCHGQRTGVQSGKTPRANGYNLHSYLFVLFTELPAAHTLEKVEWRLPRSLGPAEV